MSSQHLLGKMPTPTAEAAILRVTWTGAGRFAITYEMTWFRD